MEFSKMRVENPMTHAQSKVYLWGTIQDLNVESNEEYLYDSGTS